MIIKLDSRTDRIPDPCLIEMTERKGLIELATPAPAALTFRPQSPTSKMKPPWLPVCLGTMITMGLVLLLLIVVSAKPASPEAKAMWEYAQFE